MALPFKNGMELAQAMGFGKMYIASKQEKENEMQMESKKVNNKVIRLTEEDLHNLVKESVQKILSERMYEPPVETNFEDIDRLKNIANEIKEIMARINYGNKDKLFEAYNDIESFVIDVIGLNKR